MEKDNNLDWEDRFRALRISQLHSEEEAMQCVLSFIKSEREKVRQEVIEKIKLWKKNNYFTDPTTNEEVADEILKNLSNK